MWLRKHLLYATEATEVRRDFQIPWVRTRFACWRLEVQPVNCSLAFRGQARETRAYPGDSWYVLLPMSEIILATDRLWLREILPTDLDDLLEIWADPVAMRWYPKTLERDELAALVERNQKRYEQYGHGLWAVILQRENQFIGDCGPVWQEVDGVEELEIGYHLKPKYWGQGFATEAARGCMTYAFEKLNARRIISMIRPENLPSRHVAERNGLQIEKELFWRGYQHYVYAIERK